MEKNRSLSAQAQSLKNNIQQRERRRNDSAANRFAGPGTVPDVYEDQPRSRQAVAGENSAAVSALAAITAAAALHQPDVFRCDLCQASFTSEPQYQQHLAGPVHRKAEEKVAAERARRERLGRYGDVADAAVAAANWQGGHVSQGLGQQAQHTPASAVSGRSMSGGQQSRLNNNKRGSNGGPSTMPKAGLSHTQLVAAAHASEEELSINGWVPPSVTTQAPDTEEEENDINASSSSSEEPEQQNARSAAAQEAQHTDTAVASPKGDQLASGLGLLYSSDSESDEDTEEGDEDAGAAKKPRTSYF